jgi:hypothetical protein
MNFKFWKRNEQLKTTESKTEEKTLLEKVCEDLGKKDLYGALWDTLPYRIDRAERSYQSEKKHEWYQSPVQMAFISIYRKKYDEAKVCFEKAKEEGYSHQSITKILENFDDVIKIAEEFWKRIGVPKPEELH